MKITVKDGDILIETNLPLENGTSRQHPIENEFEGVDGLRNYNLPFRNLIGLIEKMADQVVKINLSKRVKVG